jgi:tripartite-type tricarboxylate transporter receptor subunit TctC
MKKILVAAAAALACSAAFAQYPNKAIRMIVPFPPGGAAELGARIFATPLSQQLGQPIIIETRPGAEGIIASEAVKKSDADGYTLYYGTATGMSFAPAAKKVAPYDPVNDFTPISMVGIFGFFIFSHASLPVNNINELIAYARANPGKLNYGTGNATSILATFIAGRVNFTIATPGNIAPQVKEGKVKALATLLPSRNALLPDAPTLKEAGLPDVPITPWGGLFGPAKLPKDVVDRVNKEMVILLAKPEVKEAFGRLSFEPRSSTPQELSAFVIEQLKAYGAAAKASNISLD